MARKPTDLGAVADAEIAARTARGESAETIASALGAQVSVRTIRRRQEKLRGRPSNVQPAAPRAPELATDIPETIPENAPVEMIDRWIARVEHGARTAESQGNLAALSSLAMRAASLAEARRKAMPLPKPDPNDNPDMRALAAEGEKRLLALVDDLFPK